MSKWIVSGYNDVVAREVSTCQWTQKKSKEEKMASKVERVMLVGRPINLVVELDGGDLVFRVALDRKPYSSQTGKSMKLAEAGPSFTPVVAISEDGDQVTLGSVQFHFLLPK